MNDLQILVGGAAGQGSKAAGRLIAKVLSHYGYKIYVYEDYPYLIRGGHNFSLIRASRKEKRSIKRRIDFLLALDKLTIEKHIERLDGELIFNSDKAEAEGTGVAMQTIAEEEGSAIMQNTALFGAFCKVVGITQEVMEEIVKELPKPDENFNVAKKAYDEADVKINLENKGNPSPLLTGNEALSLGAVEAGLDVYMAYPMTPSTSILHFLAELGRKYDIKVMQPENEVAVINAALGSSFAGKRTMVGTSGGGMALMAEGISLAAISETPIVLINSQRSGPASGVPTYNAQSDLKFSLGIGHGDFLRLVFAPGDAEEAFYLTNLAMNMTWKYQIPAIVLLDKDVSESTFSFDRNVLEKGEKWEELKDGGEDYERYKDTENGISPIAFPGWEATVRNTSYEHDEYGTTTEDPEMVTKMQDKRMKKLPMIKEEIERLEMVKVSGEGERVIVSWGSSKMAAKEVAERTGSRFVQILSFEPFPEKSFMRAVEGAKEIVVVEANRLGQAAEVIERYVKVDKKILKYDGRPFEEEDIIEKLN